MPTRVYKSTDAGAPTLNGQVGSLIRVLRACLVDGYGTQPPLGWSIPYTDGNNPPLRAHFRQAPKDGWSQYDLEIKDDGSTSMGDDPKFAEAWGWSNADGLGTGYVAFPIRSGAGMIARKSATADSTSRRWLLVGTDRSFIFVAYHAYGTTANAAEAWFFGDLIPLSPIDVWAVALFGNSTQQLDYPVSGIAITFDNTRTIRAIPYTFQGAPGPISFSRVWTGVDTADHTVGYGYVPYPNGPDGRGYVERVIIVESGSAHFRAVLPGFWAPFHDWKRNNTITDWMTFAGAGNLAGRSFIVAKWGDGNRTTGTVAFCIETSDTWYMM
jgi:hypothetical protein